MGSFVSTFIILSVASVAVFYVMYTRRVQPQDNPNNQPNSPIPINPPQPSPSPSPPPSNNPIPNNPIPIPTPSNPIPNTPIPILPFVGEASNAFTKLLSTFESKVLGLSGSVNITTTPSGGHLFKVGNMTVPSSYQDNTNNSIGYCPDCSPCMNDGNCAGITWKPGSDTTHVIANQLSAGDLSKTPIFGSGELYVKPAFFNSILKRADVQSNIPLNSIESYADWFGFYKIMDNGTYGGNDINFDNYAVGMGTGSVADAVNACIMTDGCAGFEHAASNGTFNLRRNLYTYNGYDDHSLRIKCPYPLTDSTVSNTVWIRDKYPHTSATTYCTPTGGQTDGGAGSCPRRVFGVCVSS